MNELRVTIPDRTRKFGYLYWRERQDIDAKTFFGTKTSVPVVLGGLFIGMKSVDFAFRRISLGPNKVRAIPKTATELRLRFNNEGALEITWQ